MSVAEWSKALRSGRSQPQRMQVQILFWLNFLKCQPLIEQRINNPNRYTVYHIQYGLVVQGASFRLDPEAWVRIPLLAIERLDNFDIQHCLQI